MRNVAPLVLPEVFEGGGVTVEFDRAVCLPPDMAGVAMGYEGASVINTMRLAAAEPALPVRGLELGTGSGVCLAALRHAVHQRQGVSIFGLDIDEAAVRITNHNLAREHDNGLAEKDIFRADWYDDETWRRLGSHFDVIMCNPPYMPEGTTLREGYETVPPTAVYAEGDGLGHYRFLLPRLLGLLSARNGATVIARFPSTTHGEVATSRLIDQVVDAAVSQAPATSDFAILRRLLLPVAPGRNLSMVTISRSDGPLPPHMTPNTQLYK